MCLHLCTLHAGVQKSWQQQWRSVQLSAVPTICKATVRCSQHTWPCHDGTLCVSSFQTCQRRPHGAINGGRGTFWIKNVGWAVGSTNGTWKHTFMSCIWTAGTLNTTFSTADTASHDYFHITHFLETSNIHKQNSVMPYILLFDCGFVLRQDWKVHCNWHLISATACACVKCYQLVGKMHCPPNTSQACKAWQQIPSSRLECYDNQSILRGRPECQEWQHALGQQKAIGITLHQVVTRASVKEKGHEQ